MNSPMPVLYSQENSDATHRHLFDMVYKFNFQLFTTSDYCMHYTTALYICGFILNQKKH